MDPQAVIAIFQDTITNHYFDMKGRVRRQTFWYFILACFVLGLGVAIVTSLIGLRILSSVFALALLLPTAGMGARRLQDIGREGSLVWLLIIPSLIMQLISLLFMVSGGPFGPFGFFYVYASIIWILNLVALVAVVAMIYFWIQPGTVGPNQYGPDPKGETPPAV